MRLKKHQILYSNIKNSRSFTAKYITIAKRFFSFEKRNVDLCYHRALSWIKKNTVPGKGIAINSFHKNIPHIEVTGYTIPTLIEAGELGLALQYAEFLLQVQRPNGSFTGSSDNKEYVFDSAQALRGLLSASTVWQRFKPFAVKTADYIISLIKEDGRIPSMYEDTTEYINVFILPVLTEASKVLGEQKYLTAAKKSLQYYKNIPDVLNTNILSHDLAYIIDGFCDMGEKDFVRSAVKEFFLRQSRNGKVLAYPDVSWCCSAGAAQFAVIGYKLGMKEEADNIIDYLCKVQNVSGGFYGSYGFFGDYFSDAEIGWTNKFFIDAVRLKKGC